MKNVNNFKINCLILAIYALIINNAFTKPLNNFGITLEKTNSFQLQDSLPWPTPVFEENTVLWMQLLTDTAEHFVGAFPSFPYKYFVSPIEKIAMPDGSIIQLYSSGPYPIGAVVYRIDKDGEMIWQRSFRRSTLGHRFIGFDILLNTEGNIDLIGGKSPIPDDLPHGFAANEKYVLSIETGEILDYNPPPTNNQQWILSGSGSVGIVANGNGKYIMAQKAWDGFWLRGFSSDMDSYNADTLLTYSTPGDTEEIEDSSPYFHDLIEWNQDTLLAYYSMYPFRDTAYGTFNMLVWLDKDGNVLKSKNINKHLQYARGFEVVLPHTQSGNYLAYTNASLAHWEVGNLASYIALFNSKDEVLWEKHIFEDNASDYRIRVAPIPGSEDYVLGVTRHPERDIKIYRLNRDGSLNLLGELNNIYTYQYSILDGLSVTAEHDILLNLFVKMDTIINGKNLLHHQSFQYLAKVDGSALGLTTSTIDKADKENPLVAYPNPATNGWQISHPENGILRFTDSHGKMLPVSNSSATNTTFISGSNLPSGVYFLQWQEKLSKELYTIKLIKE